MKVSIKNISDIISTKWSGGETKQLFILPENFTVNDDFQLRISVATLFPGESSFSKYSDYNRMLTLLEGRVKLFHEEKETLLVPWNDFNFSGNTPINSLVEVPSLDFNIIYKENSYNVEFFSNISTETFYFSSSYIFILSLEDGTLVDIESTVYVLKKYDFLILDKLGLDSLDLTGCPDEKISERGQNTNFNADDVNDLICSGRCLIAAF